VPLEDRPFSRVLVRLNLHHPFAFLKGVGAGEAWTAARETAMMGVEGAGEGVSVAEMGAGGAEALAAPSAPWRRGRGSANLAHFSSFSTIPAPRSECKRSAKQYRMQE